MPAEPWRPCADAQVVFAAVGEGGPTDRCHTYLEVLIRVLLLKLRPETRHVSQMGYLRAYRQVERGI